MSKEKTVLTDRGLEPSATTIDRQKKPFDLATIKAVIAANQTDIIEDGKGRPLQIDLVMERSEGQWIEFGRIALNHSVLERGVDPPELVGAACTHPAGRTRRN